MTINCPNCGHEIEVAIAAKRPTEDERWRNSLAALRNDMTVARRHQPLFLKPTTTDPDRPKS